MRWNLLGQVGGAPGNDYDTVYLCAGDGDGDDYFSMVSTEKILTEKFRFRCQ